ncbi:unnamed protein product [Lampetra planeri]
MVLVEGIADEVLVVCTAALGFATLAVVWFSTSMADSWGRTGPADARGRPPQAAPHTAPHTAPQPANRSSGDGGGGGASPEPSHDASATGGSGNTGEAAGDANSQSDTHGSGSVEGGSSSSHVGDHGLPSQARSSSSPSHSPVLRRRAEDQRSGGSAESLEEAVNSSSAAPEGDRLIQIRLKFLNETERIVRVRPSDTIGHFKSVEFPGQEEQVRLIYQGRLLHDDSRPLSSYGLHHGCVLHCHISQRPTAPPSAGWNARINAALADPNADGLNLGGLMLPLFLLMLVVVWYTRIAYKQLFTAPATVSLVGVTVIFSVIAFNTYRR